MAMHGVSLRAARTACLKLEAHRQLRLARIADPHAQETIKVEKRRCYQRIYVVLVIEGVKHLHSWYESHVLAKLERPHGPPIEGDILIIFPSGIALAPAGTGCRSDGLRRVRLQAGVDIESARQLIVSEQIEFMALVAV